MKRASLGELAVKLGVNKSLLSYYFQMGLLKPVEKVGRMNIFDEEDVLRTMKDIKKFKKEGLKLAQIKRV
jgi:DNA-binding transcriptional MerR regulator